MIAEKEIYMHVKSLSKALLCLFCVFYSYNLEYPKPLYSLYIFLQHTVLGLKDGANASNTVCILQSALHRFMSV